jgi:hypothetical protein
LAVGGINVAWRGIVQLHGTARAPLGIVETIATYVARRNNVRRR